MGVDTGIRLTTSDADADHAHLRGRGVDIDAEVMRMAGGVPPMFSFRDPDGNALYVVEEPLSGAGTPGGCRSAITPGRRLTSHIAAGPGALGVDCGRMCCVSTDQSGMELPRPLRRAARGVAPRGGSLSLGP